MFSVSVPWSHLTRTQQRLLGLANMSGVGEGLVSHDKCRWRRVVPMLMDMFGYAIGCQVGLPWVKSQDGFGVAMGEGLGSVWDVVRSGMNVSGVRISLGVIDSWAGAWRVEVLVKGEDAAVGGSSACGSDSESRSGSVRPVGVGTSDLVISSTSGKPSWVCAGRRAATGSETEGFTGVIVEEDQCAGMIKTLSSGWLTRTGPLSKAALILTLRTSLNRVRRALKSRRRISGTIIRQSGNVHCWYRRPWVLGT